MCAWKQFTLLGKLKLLPSSLQGRFAMLLSWCVVNNFSVCFLTGEHNSNYFQWLAFSRPPFTSFKSVYSGPAAGPARLYCLTVMGLGESFILWSTGEFTDGLGIQLTKMKNMNMTRANAYSPSLQQLHGETALS